jgi:hypothetical protein
MSDASISQHKPAFKVLDDGFAFDDDRKRILAVGFDFDAVDDGEAASAEDSGRTSREVLLRVIQAVDNGESALEVGIRFLCLKALVMPGVESQRDIAARTNISARKKLDQGTVSRRIQAMAKSIGLASSKN